MLHFTDCDCGSDEVPAVKPHKEIKYMGYSFRLFESTRNLGSFSLDILTYNTEYYPANKFASVQDAEQYVSAYLVRKLELA